MKIKWWHIAGILIIGAIFHEQVLYAFSIVYVFFAICWPLTLAIIAVTIYNIFHRKKKTITARYENAQAEADMQDLDNEMYEVETMLDQIQEVGHINDELDEIETVLDQLSGTEQADRKVIPIWDLPKKP